MAHRDKDGNKLPQPKVDKVTFGKNCRIKRTQFGKNCHPRHCSDCGFRVRGIGHADGAHHNSTVPMCSR